MPGAETVLIEQLRLLAPGLNRDEAQLLGETVARELAERLARQRPADESRRISSLEITLQAPAGASPETLQDMIVEAILEELA